MRSLPLIENVGLLLSNVSSWPPVARCSLKFLPVPGTLIFTFGISDWYEMR